MNHNADIKPDTPEFSPPHSMETHTPNSIRKIAVLFTDVVGSTQYFKDLGDVAGREMLQRHQDIASSPIVEHAGIVVKTLGDSVMAYFMDPKEAVKAAIKIQQRFLNQNRQQDPEHQILVRIGIHWGEGIIEEQDIFGNVVNLAAKIVPLAGRDQIFVSNDVCKAVTNLAPVRYERVISPHDKNDLEGLDIHQIVWDETIHFDPTADILIFLRPLWKIAGPDFKNAWTRMAKSKNRPWEETTVNTHPHDKNALILVSDEIFSAIETAKGVLSTLKGLMGKNHSQPFLPIQVLVDSGPYLRGDKIVLDYQDVNWNEISPGSLYISSSSFRLVKNKSRLKTDPTFDYDYPRPLYRLISDENTTDDNPLFMYRNALLKGPHPVCFYCGSRKHSMADCPSKKLLNLTSAFDQIGYQSLNAINGHFMGLFSESESPAGNTVSASPAGDESFQLARLVFFELNSIVQLRFLRTIWDSNSESWDDTKIGTDRGQKGGQIWMALDMIRTSRLVKAESLLNTLMLEQSQDYRVLCTQGFLYLEQNHLSKAEYNFERALMFTKTKPQRIFILFLLVRLFGIRGNLPRAEEKTEEILRIYPSCADAKYQRVIHSLRKGQHKIALAELTKLIHEKKEFFIKALIDPDLAPFSKIIDARLKKLYNEIKETAAEQFPKAESEKKRLESLLGEDADIDADIKELWKKTEQLLLSDSYFGFWHIIKISNLVVHRCISDIANWKKKIGKILLELSARLQQDKAFVQNYPYQFITSGIRKQIQSIHEELKNIEDIVVDEEVSQFKEAHRRAVGLSDRMKKFPAWLNGLKKVQNSVYFLFSFFKASLTLQTINLLVGIILLPVLSHYVVVLFPNLTDLNQNLWFYQKGYLIFGGILGLIMAIIKPLRKLPSKS
jgi:class 3 adenylate cyclase/tetratricopeptide (TPR) repeat protein